MAGAGLGLFAAGQASAQARGVTPTQEIGPFYPAFREGENLADLTRVAGQNERARGDLIEVTGRVLNREGGPVGLALVLVWQADAAGQYPHPRNTERARVDPGFGGHALLRTAPDGVFSLLSIRPGAYPDDRASSGLRTPHLHFEVIGEESRLLTQMYFPDEPLNDADVPLSQAARNGGDPAMLIARRADAVRDSAALGLSWDVVLAGG